jgi:hypothetical protein
MSDFRKFQNYRIDLSEIYAFYVNKKEERSSLYNDKIILYPRTRPKDRIEVYYKIGKDELLFEETVKILDEYFSVKTEEESRILP